MGSLERAKENEMYVFQINDLHDFKSCRWTRGPNLKKIYSNKDYEQVTFCMRYVVKTSSYCTYCPCENHLVGNLTTDISMYLLGYQISIYIFLGSLSKRTHIVVEITKCIHSL